MVASSRFVHRNAGRCSHGRLLHRPRANHSGSIVCPPSHPRHVLCIHLVQALCGARPYGAPLPSKNSVLSWYRAESGVFFSFVRASTVAETRIVDQGLAGSDSRMVGGDLGHLGRSQYLARRELGVGSTVQREDSWLFPVQSDFCRLGWHGKPGDKTECCDRHPPSQGPRVTTIDAE